MAKNHSITYGIRTHVEIEEESRCCEICKTTKPIADFRTQARHGRVEHRSACKTCRHNKQRAINRAENACLRCGQTFLPLTKYRHCVGCLQNANLGQRQRHLERREKNLCIKCGKVPPASGRLQCRPCLDKVRAITKRVHKKYLDSGLCFRCGQAPMNISQRLMRRQQTKPLPVCETCYIKSLTRAATGSSRAWKAIAEKFQAQGGRCPYTNSPIALGVNASIDHILPVSRFPEQAANIDNLEWIRYDINIIKRDLTKDEFLQIIGQIANRTKRDTGIW